MKGFFFSVQTAHLHALCMATNDSALVVAPPTVNGVAINREQMAFNTFMIGIEGGGEDVRKSLLPR